MEVTLQVSFHLLLWGIGDFYSNLVIDVIKYAADPTTRPQAINFFKRE